MEPKLFVGNLPMAITEDQLQQVFGAYGSIDRVVLIDKASPSGSRSGFVIYTDHSFAQIAIAALHGNYAFPGSADNVVVRYADSAKGDRRASVPNFAAPVPQMPGAGGTAEAKLFVGNLPATITEGELSAVFTQYGPLDRIVMMEKASPSGARSAFVIYTQHPAAAAAIQALHAQYVFSGGQEAVVVRYADSAKGAGAAAAPAAVATASTDLKLFVGNLPAEATQETLTELMSQYGQVTHIHMMRNPTSTGAICAFVEYAANAQCHAAIAALNSVYAFPPRDTAMTVQFAKRQGPKAASGGPPGPAQPAAPVGEVKLFVGNLPLSITQDQLRDMFMPFGNLIEAFLFKRGTETAKGAFVRFSDAGSADAAMRACNHLEVAGQSILVQPAREKGAAPPAAAPAPPAPAPDPFAQWYGAVPQYTDPYAQYAAYGAPYAAYPSAVAGAAAGAAPAAHAAGGARGETVTLQLASLPPNYTEANVSAMFAMFGNVVGCSVAPEAGGQTGRGTVTFSSRASADLAQSTMHDFQIGSYRLRCTKAGGYRPY